MANSRRASRGERWGPGGEGRLGGAPTAARGAGGRGKKPRRRRPTEAPVKWEFEEGGRDLVVKTEKFRGLSVMLNFPLT
jgi:hypothetical protein